MKKPDNEGWQRPIEEPKCTREDGPLEGDRFTHPAFAQISAHRTSGGKVLYGSDFQHNGYVTIKIVHSSVRRSLSTDWPYGESRPITEVAMSESQWAHFVSAMNIGSGTQCTLLFAEGQHVPGLPRPVDRQDQFGAESAARMARAVESLAKARAAIEASGLSKTKQVDILKQLAHAESDVTQNQKFVADMFAEHMEKTVDDAKIEVGAYINGAVRQVGLDALQRAGVAPLTLDFPERRQADVIEHGSAS